jgi:hypothetical protein
MPFAQWMRGTLATAALTIPSLAQPDEQVAFASRDPEQAAVAELLGFNRV